MDIEKIITQNLRIFRSRGTPFQDGAELTRIERISVLLSEILEFKTDRIVLLDNGEETTITLKDTVLFLHQKVYPVLYNIIESSGLYEEDMKRRPTHYNIILHFKNYMNTVEDTERLATIIQKYFPVENDE
jgi:hypothetical protein